MRKILSLFMVVCMLFSITTMVSAEEKQTTIRYVADGTSSYEVTVPSLMTPGETKQVTLEGTWTTEEKVVVTAPDSVVLTNDIDGDTEELSVTFDDLSVVGDNRGYLSLSQDITVASMPEDVIFGTWEGIITYTVSVEDSIEIFSFYIESDEFQAEDGMTWGEWLESDYCTHDSLIIGEEDKIMLVIDNGDDTTGYMPLTVTLTGEDGGPVQDHYVTSIEKILTYEEWINTYGEEQAECYAYSYGY